MSKHEVMNKGHRSVRSGGGDFQDVFQGTTAIYVIERDGYADLFVGDYEINAMRETWKEQLRANRQRKRRKGRAVPRLPADSLHDKVLIAFGPQVSPKQAVAALERAIESIKGHGLLIGRDSHGNIAWEEVGGSIIV